MWLIPAAFLLLVVVVGSWFLTSTRVQYVVPGEVLRSRQLEPDELRDAIEEHGLRTVISLRGSPPGEQWPDEQRAVCARNGVGYESTHFSVDEWPAQHEVRRLVHLFETADQPILIHCYRGADRTGWAAAVKLLLEGRDLDDALVHLSPRYGHVCNRDSCPLHFFFDSYQSHLGRRALAGGSEDFRVWVLEYYCPEPYNAGLSLVSEIPMRVSPGERIRATVRAVNNGSFSWRMTDLETTGVRLGARRIGPFDVAPENAIDIFRTPDGPAVDLARAGLEFGVMAPGNREELRTPLQSSHPARNLRDPGRYGERTRSLVFRPWLPGARLRGRGCGSRRLRPSPGRGPVAAQYPPPLFRSASPLPRAADLARDRFHSSDNPQVSLILSSLLLSRLQPTF